MTKLQACTLKITQKTWGIFRPRIAVLTILAGMLLTLTNCRSKIQPSLTPTNPAAPPTAQNTPTSGTISEGVPNHIFPTDPTGVIPVPVTPSTDHQSDYVIKAQDINGPSLIFAGQVPDQTNSSTPIANILITITATDRSSPDTKTCFDPSSVTFASCPIQFSAAVDSQGHWSVAIPKDILSESQIYSFAASAPQNAAMPNPVPNLDFTFTWDTHSPPTSIDVTPRIFSVTANNTNGTYKVGDEIAIEVHFSGPVTVTGTPILRLQPGASERFATYASGSGTSTLIFKYIVQANESANDLDYASSSALVLGSGTITGSSGSAATITLPAPGASGSLGSSQNIAVEGTPETTPKIISVNTTNANGTYHAGDEITIEVHFSGPVTVTGTPTLALHPGSTDRVAVYQSGSGTSTLIFKYVIQINDTATDLDYASTAALVLNSGSIKGTSGNDATITLPTPSATGSLGANQSIVIDGTPATTPKIISVTAVSSNGSYTIGDEITIAVNFSGPVTVSGAPTLILHPGTTDRVAIYQSGSGTSTLIFKYVIQINDNAADLDYASTAALVLNSGAIKGSSGNDAILVLPAPGTTSSLGGSQSIVIDGIDAIAPVPGNAGQITLSNVQQTSLSLGWTKANDDKATAARIQYLVYYSTANNISTVGNAEANGTAVGTFAADIDSITVINLTPGTTYYFSVITKDAAGNKSLYSVQSQATNAPADTTPPQVDSIISPQTDNTYSVSEGIDISVSFSEVVRVTGTPTLQLETGSVDRTINYIGGDNTPTLHFLYIVQTGDFSNDLNYKNTNSLALNGGTIKDAAGNDAILTLPATADSRSLGGSMALVIDTSAAPNCTPPWNPATPSTSGQHGWAWLSGTLDITITEASFGVKNTPAATNKAPPVSQYALCADGSGNLYSFGGLGNDINKTYGILGDLWRWNGTTWTWISGTGGRNTNGSYGTQNVPHPNNLPGGRYDAFCWFDASNNLWLFGGNGLASSGTTKALNDLWKWDGSAWTWVSGSSAGDALGVYGTINVANAANHPGGRGNFAAWTDGTAKLWIFGGGGCDSVACAYGQSNDLWYWDGTNWTWLSGSTTSDHVGVYGTKNIANAANVPGSRQSVGAWRTSNGDLWLFGGDGYNDSGQGSLNDVWKWNGSAWTWMSGRSDANTVGSWGTKGQAAGTNEPSGRGSFASWSDGTNFWVYGGYGVDSAGSTGLLQDLWRWDGSQWTWIKGVSLRNTRGTWGTIGVANAGNQPPARRNGRGVQVGANGFVAGGYIQYTDNSDYIGNDIWKWDNTSWTWISGDSQLYETIVPGTLCVGAPANNPGPRPGFASVKTSEAFYLLGGNGKNEIGDVGLFHDLWAFDGVNWRRTSGTSAFNSTSVHGTKGVGDAANHPGSRSHSTMVSTGSSLWVYGGQGFDGTGNSGWLGDLWSWDGQFWTWHAGVTTRNALAVYGTQGVAHSANHPGGRDRAAVWATASNNIWIFGGFYIGLGWSNELWHWDGSNWTWVNGDNQVNHADGNYGVKGVAAGTNAPRSRAGAAYWVDGNGVFWLFGGVTTDSMGTTVNLNDLWKFDGVNWTWVSGSSTPDQIATYGTKGISAANNTPSAREDALFWYDSSNHVLWLFGGRGVDSGGNTGTLSDLWAWDGTNWTWMDGSTLKDVKPVAATQGVASGSNYPGGHQSGALWGDDADSLWIFSSNAATLGSYGTESRAMWRRFP